MSGLLQDTFSLSKPTTLVRPYASAAKQVTKRSAPLCTDYRGSAESLRRREVQLLSANRIKPQGVLRETSGVTAHASRREMMQRAMQQRNKNPIYQKNRIGSIMTLPSDQQSALNEELKLKQLQNQQIRPPTRQSAPTEAKKLPDYAPYEAQLTHADRLVLNSARDNAALIMRSRKKCAANLKVAPSRAFKPLQGAQLASADIRSKRPFPVMRARRDVPTVALETPYVSTNGQQESLKLSRPSAARFTQAAVAGTDRANNADTFAAIPQQPLESYSKSRSLKATTAYVQPTAEDFLPVHANANAPNTIYRSTRRTYAAPRATQRDAIDGTTAAELTVDTFRPRIDTQRAIAYPAAAVHDAPPKYVENAVIAPNEALQVAVPKARATLTAAGGKADLQDLFCALPGQTETASLARTRQSIVATAPAARSDVDAYVPYESIGLSAQSSKRPAGAPRKWSIAPVETLPSESYQSYAALPVERAHETTARPVAVANEATPTQASAAVYLPATTQQVRRSKARDMAPARATSRDLFDTFEGGVHLPPEQIFKGTDRSVQASRASQPRSNAVTTTFVTAPQKALNYEDTKSLISEICA